MLCRTKYLIPLALTWGGAAAAQGEVTAQAPADDVDCSKLSADDCELLKKAESVPIYDERPDKPFDRDTVARITGAEAAARGAVDLSSALALIPDVIVQPGGRGGTKIDIRGGSKGEVSVLIDGVLVSDPYYGTFDLTSIPITDIVEIRVSTTPQSPIDGPGGPGGVVEVHTRDAVGPQLVMARATTSSLPLFNASGTARTMLSKTVGLRMSVSTLESDHEYDLQSPQLQTISMGEGHRDNSGAARLEYREGDRRVVLDGFVDDRHYLVTPDETSTTYELVDRETNGRLAIKGDDKIDKYQVQAELSYQYLYRRTLDFVSVVAPTAGGLEDLTSNREDAMALVTHPIGKEARWVASVNVQRDAADVHDITYKQSTGADALVEPAADLQYEHGTVRLDGAGGVAIPFNINNGDPWPETKLVARWRPNYGHLELTATGGYKGRLPSVRERFSATQGNPDLRPEKATHAEVRAIASADRFRVEVAPFYRYVDGLINPNPVAGGGGGGGGGGMGGQFINFDPVTLYGVDSIARVDVTSNLQVGGSYDYVRDHSDTLGNDPINHLPHNRADGWVKVFVENASLLTRVVYFGPSNNQAFMLPAYTVVEANATWQPSRKYMLVLHGEDLTNQRPETQPHVFGPGRVIALILQGSWE